MKEDPELRREADEMFEQMAVPGCPPVWLHPLSEIHPDPKHPNERIFNSWATASILAHVILHDPSNMNAHQSAHLFAKASGVDPLGTEAIRLIHSRTEEGRLQAIAIIEDGFVKHCQTVTGFVGGNPR